MFDEEGATRLVKRLVCRGRNKQFGEESFDGRPDRQQSEETKCALLRWSFLESFRTVQTSS